MERRAEILQNPNFAEKSLRIVRNFAMLFVAAGLFVPSLINPVTAAFVAAGVHLGAETFKR